MRKINRVLVKAYGTNQSDSSPDFTLFRMKSFSLPKKVNRKSDNDKNNNNNNIGYNNDFTIL